ncbi:MAG: DUF1932 domain-containing protein [Dehalococcoidia bacterium]|nr:DUF1932 domain-containing protein [Dehalococcoidia bacterium]
MSKRAVPRFLSPDELKRRAAWAAGRVVPEARYLGARARRRVEEMRRPVNTPTGHHTATVGVVHPGQMGSAVGASARAAGARVVWVSEDRSPATVQRAESDGLEDVHWLNGLVNQSDVLLSVCPPHAAEEVAQEVLNLGFQGVYVDANAISPSTSRRIEAEVLQCGGTFVDGGIIGGPPRRPGATRMYLSGDMAPKVASILSGGPLEVIPIAGGAGAASALKVAYAAWSKGTTALLADILALSLAEGVHDALLQEWRKSQPDVARRAERDQFSAPKAWRFAGEMEEIADTFAADGLPDGFHRAAADVYRRLDRFKDDPDAPKGAELARWLLEGRD